MKRAIAYIFFIGFGILAILFFTASFIIGNHVEKYCQVAQGKYVAGDCIESLSILLKDESNSFRERNNAIWALGQLGDKKSLEALERYYTGEEKSRKLLDENLSQYELKKAISLIKKRNNITAFVWRYRIEK